MDADAGAIIDDWRSERIQSRERCVMCKTVAFCLLMSVGGNLAAAGPAETPTPGPQVVKITLQPMAAPRPALKYQLLSGIMELKPGNAVQGYLRARASEFGFYENEEAERQREKWIAAPLGDLKSRDLAHYGGESLRHVHEAARLDRADWQALDGIKSKGLWYLLPDVQDIARIKPALQVRLRGEIAERDFDAALATEKTLFAMSQHMSAHPSFVGCDCGNSFANSALHELEEMIRQPNCPNFYWALSNLPTPFVSLERGVQSQGIAIPEFAPLSHNAPMSEPELERLVISVAQFKQFSPVKEDTAVPDPAARLKELANDKGAVRAARERLIQAGIAPLMVDRFPPLQVVLLDEVDRYEEQRDELMKTLLLPYWQTSHVARLSGKKRPAIAPGVLAPAIGQRNTADAGSR